ncbi:MAG: Rab family GTPase [Candidatus Thorarchaeota archaeon]|jgi:small GTP-binding protein
MPQLKLALALGEIKKRGSIRIKSRYVYKICIVGAASVGKTSTVNRWAHGWFRHDYKSTVGVQHFSRNLVLGKGKKKATIKLILWDMAGQDIFKELRKSFYDGASGIVLMCDITRKRTFNQLPKWYSEATKNIGEKVPAVVVANKVDKKPHRVEELEVSNYAKSLKAPYIITSALSGSNITDLFKLIGRMVHEEIQEIVPKGHDWSKESGKMISPKKTSKSKSKKKPKKKSTKDR